MAILAYVGLPGHGKSYGIVENVIIPALKQKRTVFSNIPMNDDVCLDVFGMTVIPFHTDDIIKNPNWFTDVFIAGSIWICDELWRLWPSGLKATAVREGDKAFLAEHRHLVGENGYATEIYFVTQDLSQVAQFARSLVESTFRMVKRTNIGFDNRFRVDIYSGAVTGSKPPISKREREIHDGKFKKEIYRFYKSHTKSQTGEAGDESKTDKRGNSLGRLSIKLAFIFLIVCVVFGYFGFGELTDKYSPKPVEPLPVSPSEKSSPNKPPVKPSVDPKSGAVYSRTSAVYDDQPGVKPPKFLASAKSFYISHSITSKGSQVWFYKVIFQDTEVVLSEMDLRKIGYAMLHVNDCLVKVSGADYSGFFMCPKPTRRDGGSTLIAGLTDGVRAVTPNPSVDSSE